MFSKTCLVWVWIKEQNRKKGRRSVPTKSFSCGQGLQHTGQTWFKLWCISPLTERTEGEGMKSLLCSPPSHHNTSTGSGGPRAAHVRLKGSPAKAATSLGSSKKWGTPENKAENRTMFSNGVFFNVKDCFVLKEQDMPQVSGVRSHWQTFHCDPSRLRGNDCAVIFHLAPVLPSILLLHGFNTEEKKNGYFIHKMTMITWQMHTFSSNGINLFFYFSWTKELHLRWRNVWD